MCDRSSKGYICKLWINDTYLVFFYALRFFFFFSYVCIWYFFYIYIFFLTFKRANCLYHTPDHCLYLLLLFSFFLRSKSATWPSALKTPTFCRCNTPLSIFPFYFFSLFLSRCTCPFCRGTLLRDRKHRHAISFFLWRLSPSFNVPANILQDHCFYFILYFATFFPFFFYW